MKTIFNLVNTMNYANDIVGKWISADGNITLQNFCGKLFYENRTTHETHYLTVFQEDFRNYLCKDNRLSLSIATIGISLMVNFPSDTIMLSPTA